MDTLAGFVAAAFALAGSPGPATLSLAATGAAFGARRGLAYLAGIVAGMVLVIGIVASGVTGLLLAVPGATPLLAGLGAAYIGYLALRIATAPPLAAPGAGGRRPSFGGGVLLSLVNPKGYAALASLFSGFALARDRIALDITLKLALLVAIMVIVNVAWLALGAALTGAFRDPVLSRRINVAFALLLVASVALALLL
jgi:threonine/homoserine/homoserine lactone efflux protein